MPQLCRMQVNQRQTEHFRRGTTWASARCGHLDVNKDESRLGDGVTSFAVGRSHTHGSTKTTLSQNKTREWVERSSRPRSNNIANNRPNTFGCDGVSSTHIKRVTNVIYHRRCTSHFMLLVVSILPRNLRGDLPPCLVEDISRSR